MRHQVTLIAALLLCGCSGPQQEVRAVAQEFVRAGDNGDWPGVAATLTRTVREGTRGSVLTHKQKEPWITVGEATVNGEDASVALRDKSGAETTLLLRKEDKQWRIWGAKIYPKEGPFGSLTLNFEKPEAIGSTPAHK